MIIHTNHSYQHMALDVAGVLRDRAGVVSVLKSFGQEEIANYIAALPRSDYDSLASRARISDAGHRAQRSIDALILELSDMARDIRYGHELPDPEPPF